MKKVVSILLSILICFMAVPLHMIGFADDNYCPFDGGSGTEKDPYKISSAYYLKRLAELINDSDDTEYNFAYYIQTKDIDLKDENFTPIGIYFNNDGTNLTENSVFCGHYNGNYHSIYNLNVDYDNRYTGLFGRIGGGEASKKAICSVENLSVYGSIKSNVTNTPVIGGIAGEIGYGAIVKNCSFTGDLSGAGYVGGITGYICAGGEIISCYSNVSINSSEYAGGIVSTVHIGKNELSKDAKIKNCYTFGNIKSENKKCGIFSNLIDDGVIKNSLIIENNYYMDTLSDMGSPNNIGGCSKLDADFMKNVNELLGSPFVYNESEEINDGYPVFEWQAVPYQFRGSGTADDPYQISSKEELEKMRDLVNSKFFNSVYGHSYYIQTNDIDLKNEPWTPIGLGYDDTENGSVGQGDYNWQTRMFYGSYDGNNKYIKNLSITENWKQAGLFGFVRGKTGGPAIVKNLVVCGNINTPKSQDSGGIVGQIQYSGNVNNCAFIGNITESMRASGGIAGYIWAGGTISNCYHNGNVTSEKYAGGVVGDIEFGPHNANGDKSIIENCYHVNGIVKGLENSNSITGICTYYDGIDNYTYVNNCYAIKGDVSGNISENHATNYDVTELSENMMRNAADKLGEAFVKNPDINFNNGYPVFTWQIKGDINGDGVFNKLDVIILQKWLLADSSVTLKNWKNADLCEDNSLDVFDLVMMKQILIQ